MDVFIEYLAKGKTTFVDTIIAVLSVIFGILGAISLFWLGFILSLSIPFAGFFLVLAGVAVIYGMIKVIGALNVEYEYAITNDELDIDKVVNRRKRTNMISCTLRRLEWFGIANDELCDKYFDDKNIRNIYACTDPSGGYHYIVTEVDLEKVMVLFNPNEKMVEHIKNLNRDKKFMV